MLSRYQVFDPIFQLNKAKGSNKQGTYIEKTEISRMSQLNFKTPIWAPNPSRQKSLFMWNIWKSPIFTKNHDFACF